MHTLAKTTVAGFAAMLMAGTALAADIKIGVLVPTTGGQATYGQDMANSVQLAMDQLNKAGGGNTYSAVVGDDGCDPQQAVNAATKLAASGIAAVVGGYCSGATVPTLKIFGDAKIPFVITAANSTKLIPANPGNAFMINSTGNDQVAKAMDFWKSKGVKSLAIVNEGDAYSQDLATLAQKGFTDAGGTVLRSLGNFGKDAGELKKSVARRTENRPPARYGWYRRCRRPAPCPPACRDCRSSAGP